MCLSKFLVTGPLKSTNYFKASLTVIGVGNGCLGTPFLAELGLLTNTNL
jgi:hypothetical protein